jgi:hypothetical protein
LKNVNAEYVLLFYLTASDKKPCPGFLIGENSQDLTYCFFNVEGNEMYT